MKTRKRWLFSILMLALVAAGCDSGGDDDGESSETDLFVGAWTAVEVEDDEGDKTDLFNESVGALTFTFERGGTYSLSAAPQNGGEGLQVENGTYTVDEDEDTLRLSGLPGFGQVTLNYDFQGDDTIDLVADESLVTLFNAAAGGAFLSGDVTLTITRQ